MNNKKLFLILILIIFVGVDILIAVRLWRSQPQTDLPLTEAIPASLGKVLNLGQADQQEQKIISFTKPGLYQDQNLTFTFTYPQENFDLTETASPSSDCKNAIYLTNKQTGKLDIKINICQQIPDILTASAYVKRELKDGGCYQYIFDLLTASKEAESAYSQILTSFSILTEQDQEAIIESQGQYHSTQDVF